MQEFQTRVASVISATHLAYDQKLRQLAALALEAMPYPELSPECAEALDKRIICDMYEGNTPYTARYILPDYEKAMGQGLRYLELDAPTTLADAVAFLQVMYANVPSVTTYPVYLGDLDKLLEPFVDDSITDAELDATLRRLWIGIDRMQPDAFVHTDLGPHDSRITRSIFRVERSLRQAVPNITLKVDPDLTPDSLLLDAIETVFQTAKPHFVNHPMMVNDHGEHYASVSCYNSLKIGGGSYSLVRLNLKEAALRHEGSARSFLDTTLARYVELTSELLEARIRSLVEDQKFFESSWLAREGLIAPERFSAMFGIFGLAECVNVLMAHDGAADERYGHSKRANRFGVEVIERVAELVAQRPQPYCEGGGGFAYLHSQSGIDLDDGVTAGTRIPVGEEPDLLSHIETCAPHHRHFASGVSDIFHFDDTATRNPEAIVDIIRGAFGSGMRDFTFNLDSNEFIRITGYLVRKCDLVGIDDRGARHTSDFLAAGSENAYHLTERASKRIVCNERDPRPGN